MTARGEDEGVEEEVGDADADDDDEGPPASAESVTFDDDKDKTDDVVGKKPR